MIELIERVLLFYTYRSVEKVYDAGTDRRSSFACYNDVQQIGIYASDVEIESVQAIFAILRPHVKMPWILKR